MQATIKLTGFKELEEKLKKLAPVVSTKLGAKALKKGGELIADQARSLVPIHTGRLHDSIIVVADRPQGRGEVRGVIGFKKGRPSMARRAMFVEFGTVRTPPQPFLRPALDSRGEQAIALIGGELERGIEAEARKK